MPLTLVEALHRVHQQVVADAAFLVLGDQLVLERSGVDQEVLPLALAAFVALEADVERGVAAHRHPAVHRHDFVLGDAEVGRDLGHVRRLQIAFLERVDLVFHPAKVEEQFLLRRRGAHLHEAPGAEDEFLDRGADPPHGVGGEAETPVGLELLHALHQPDIPFGNQLADRQAVAAIAHCDLRNEAKVRIDQLGGRFGIAMLAPALGQHEFLLGGEDREFLDFGKVAVESALPAGSG